MASKFKLERKVDVAGRVIFCLGDCLMQVVGADIFGEDGTKVRVLPDRFDNKYQLNTDWPKEGKIDDRICYGGLTYAVNAAAMEILFNQRHDSNLLEHGIAIYEKSSLFYLTMRRKGRSNIIRADNNINFGKFVTHIHAHPPGDDNEEDKEKDSNRGPASDSDFMIGIKSNCPFSIVCCDSDSTETRVIKGKLYTYTPNTNFSQATIKDFQDRYDALGKDDIPQRNALAKEMNGYFTTSNRNISVIVSDDIRKYLVTKH